VPVSIGKDVCVSSIDDTLADLLIQAEAAAQTAVTMDGLRQAEAGFTGKKGSLSALLKEVKNQPADQRGPYGQKVNQAKGRIQAIFKARQSELHSAADASEKAGAAAFDASLPAPPQPFGSVHPVTAIQWEIEEIFTQLGFVVADGPEMESEFYNFEALNILDWHPTRDTQDTFWLSNQMLLRTQTSAVQPRAMKQYGPPLRVIAPGRCFRYETIDASHENTFHQLEGLMVDKDISIANLIAAMRLLLREVFQRDVAVRLRPGYFPFVEPGFELDMSCMICDGKGCATCKRSGWIEILPCGMVHPNVLKLGGIDPHEYTGFAFGLGLTRLAMMKYGIRDIRVMNAGDLRPLVHADRLTGPTIAVT
jgi:phenylalanyl-tRNA synthetase alpha chain